MTDDITKAIASHQAGDLVTAEQSYIKILGKTDNKNCHYLLGLLYSQKKHYISAIRHLEKSLPLNTKDGNFYNALAICYQKTCKFKTAKRLIDIAISLSPDNPGFCNRKSKILVSESSLTEAVENTLKCINKYPDFIPAYQTCFSLYNKQSRPDNALRLIKHAFSLFPKNPEIIFSLAEAYLNTAHYKKAKEIFSMLAQHQFKILECFNNLGIIERDLGNIDKAKEYFEEANKLDKNNSIVEWNLGLLHLLKGDYPTGWKTYDARLSAWGKLRNYGDIATWQGENLNNKSILILSEQGIGDQILFASGFKAIILQSRETIIQCDNQLRNIFCRSFPEATIVTESNLNTITTNKIDYKIHSGSIFQFIDDSQLPRVFLKPEITSNFKLDKSKLNIGFSWKGSTIFKEFKKRSTHLRSWFSLLANNQYQFYCLQHNISERDHSLLVPFSSNISFPEAISQKNNIDALTNIISKLDLVISVTNTNVHLAGALGIKTWCLAPKSPDWPWGLTKEDCRWYSSVKIFRQHESDWESTFFEIEMALKTLESDRNKKT